MTTPHYSDDNVTLYHGDCLDVLAQLPDASVDSVVTDPPYGLEFMGKDWDAPWKSDGENLWATRDKSDDLSGKSSSPFLAAAVNKYRAGLPFQQWCQQWATECLRVLKPGGHLLAFGGTRTWHRLAAAVEDAGFEIRDSIAWLYGSGFPKSLDVSKAIDKAAGAEREKTRTPITPRSTAGKGLSNELDERPWLTAARKSGYHEHDSDIPATPAAQQWQGWGTALKPAFEPIVVGRKPLTGTVAGNVLAHGVGALNIDGCRVAYEPADLATRTARTGNMAGTAYGHRGTVQYSGGEVAAPHTAGRWPSNVVIDPDTAEGIDRQSGHSVSAAKSSGKVPDMRGNNFNSGDKKMLEIDTPAYGDEGGASRFFPTFRYHAKANSDERPTANGIAHPTVKPLDLMRWLIRLVTPPGGLVLEPFAGSGTTAEAAIHEHMRCIAIEREDDYLPLIVARLTKPMEIGFDFEVGA